MVALKGISGIPRQVHPRDFSFFPERDGGLLHGKDLKFIRHPAFFYPDGLVGRELRRG
jgi:hypothetical protein